MTEEMHINGITLADYAAIIWRRKALLIVLFTAAVLITMAVSLMMPNQYRSETVIMAIAPETGGLSAALSASPLAGALTGSLGGLSAPADRILVVLRSRTIAEMVINRFDLVKVFNADRWDPAKGAWKVPEKPPIMEDVVKKLGKKVTSFRKSREGSITITVEWKDPKLAAQIANYYIVALAEFMKDKSHVTTIQIIDPAVPAERKSSPKIALNTIMAGIMSLFVGAFIALMLERRSLRQRS